MKMEIPKIGSVFEVNGVRHEILGFHHTSDEYAPDIILSDSKKNKVVSLWLPFWSLWAKNATPVS